MQRIARWRLARPPIEVEKFKKSEKSEKFEKFVQGNPVAKVARVLDIMNHSGIANPPRPNFGNSDEMPQD